MLKCLDCGKTFEEVATWEESRGEFWGFPCYERMAGCPYCFSEDVIDEDEEEEKGEEDDC